MMAPLLLLLLTLRPSPRPAQELRLRAVVRGDYDMAKAGGPWPRVSDRGM